MDRSLRGDRGLVHYAVSGLLTTLAFIQDGKLIAPALVIPGRSALLPDVPTVAETIPGYKRDGSQVMPASAGTPAEVPAKVRGEVRRIHRLPKRRSE